MKNEISVSVLVLTYNQEDFITEAILSILNQQTSFQYEIIIADDYSTDNTQLVIQNVISTHEKGQFVKYFRHSQNIGPYLNTEFGFKQCLGKYIALCEGDDYWSSVNKLQNNYEFLESNLKYSIIMNAIDIKIGDKLFKSKENKYLNKIGYDFKSYFRYQFSQTSSFFFRNVIELPDWYSLVYAGDFALVALCSKHGELYYEKNANSVYRARIHSGLTRKNRWNILKLYSKQILLNRLLVKEKKIKDVKFLRTNILAYIFDKTYFKIMTQIYKII